MQLIYVKLWLVYITLENLLMCVKWKFARIKRAKVTKKNKL